MKQVTLYFFLLILSAVFSFNMAQGMYIGANEKILENVTGNDNQDKITSAVILSGVADISWQQSGSSGVSHFVPKHRTVQPSFTDSFGRLLARKSMMYSTEYKAVFCHFRDYCARQKVIGYYIYTLRKIVI